MIYILITILCFLIIFLIFTLLNWYKINLVKVDPVIIIQHGIFDKIVKEKMGDPSNLLESLKITVNENDFPNSESISFEFDNNKNEKGNKLYPSMWAAAAIDGSTYQASIWGKWLMTDDTAIKGFEHMTGEEIHGFSDFINTANN